MACECYVIGGPWISFDPQCEAHGYEAQARQEAVDAQTAELQAWRERFPQYEYRPQDHGVFLKFGV